MKIEELSTKTLTIIFLLCGVFLIGYAAVHWPSWEGYLFLTIAVVGIVIVLCSWRQRVRYLKHIEYERELVRKKREASQGR